MPAPRRFTAIVSGAARAGGVLLGGCVFLYGCATGLTVTGEETTEAAGRRLTMQRQWLEPRNGGRLVDAAELEPGDIMLSAAASVPSVGIRLLTLAPVSHAALYVGQGQVVEAVGSGVRLRPIAAVIDEEVVIVVLRHPGVDAARRETMRAFALASVGSRYDHVGIMLQAPVSLQRRLCELPLLPSSVRDYCIRGVAAIHLGTARNDRFFCSQFVLEAYRRADLPLTSADPRWLSPSDILHMREGDVPSVKSLQSLEYVGHLKFRLPGVAAPTVGGS
ncbi:MAG: distant relative of cell wall-associated hydrolase [Burkholderiales bacterium]